MTEKTSREDEIKRWLEGHSRAWEACDQLEQADGHLRYLLEKVDELEGLLADACTSVDLEECVNGDELKQWWVEYRDRNNAT